VPASGDPASGVPARDESGPVEVFRPVRWWVLGKAVVVALAAVAVSLAWPEVSPAVRLAGLAVGLLLAVAVAEPATERVEVGAGRVRVRSLARGIRDFVAADSTWSVAEVPVSIRRGSRRVEVLTLAGADGRLGHVVLRHYYPDDKDRMVATVGQALTGRD
jgi:hypothetical protein